jgi:hypothetical protein
MALTSATGLAAPAQVVTQASQYGLLAPPFTTHFGQSQSPLAAGYASTDYFVSDYGFSIETSASFSSAVVTFDLGQVLQLSGLSMRLLQGSTPWSGALPAAMSAGRHRTAQRQHAGLGHRQRNGAGDTAVDPACRQLCA